METDDDMLERARTLALKVIEACEDAEPACAVLAVAWALVGMTRTAGQDDIAAHKLISGLCLVIPAKAG